MIKTIRRQNIFDAPASAGLIALYTRNDGVKPRKHSGSRTHRTRLYSYIHSATDKSFRAKLFCRAANGDHFRVQGGIIPAFNAIKTSADDFAVLYYHRADRNLADTGGLVRLA
jgi:hypothetical protein